VTSKEIREEQSEHLTLSTSEKRKKVFKTLLLGEICREIELRG
jgi:hypothetical protein